MYPGFATQYVKQLHTVDLPDYSITAANIARTTDDDRLADSVRSGALS